MARTMPFPFDDHLPTSASALPGLDAYVAKVQALVDEYALALGDADMAADPEDASFHEGRLDALEQALLLLLDVPPDAWRAHHVGR